MLGRWETRESASTLGLQQTFNPYPDIFLNIILSMRAAWQASRE
jgi:uncharacterized membrane protein